MTPTKTCSKCHETKPLDEFSNQRTGKDGKTAECKKCRNKYSGKYNQEHKEERAKYHRDWYEKTGRQRLGQQSMYENKLCANYLGIVIAERLIRHLFKDVEVMPNNHSGYDFICNRRKKIDVKSGCVTFTKKNPRWIFNIDYNKKCDFFILVAFDNRSDLNPLHLWMIPGKEINNNASKSIRPSTLHKWSQWERDIKDARICCNEMKKNNINTFKTNRL